LIYFETQLSPAKHLKMHFTTLPIILSAIPLALAQYGYGDSGSSTSTSASASAATTTSSGSSSVHTVQVGNSGLNFSPNDFTASVGDTVEFHFYGPKHSVAQSTFASPCMPASNLSFFSGPISTTGTGQNSEVYTITINSTSAIWIYCAVPSHCESGMAAVINAP
jgi:plastocyanin